jgi:hypothetical protein
LTPASSLACKNKDATPLAARQGPFQPLQDKFLLAEMEWRISLPRSISGD